MNDLFYRAFEDRYRGPRETIKSRLHAYLPFIRPLVSLYPSSTALDLGCGRGEWLELLGENGFDARGIDLDEGMLAACRERGLKAEKADALESLRKLPNESVSLVSAFHLVEHIAFDDVRALVREALRVLKPGGLLVLETPNPENLVVGASTFYMDPSHLRPIPPELLSFAVEHGGFHRHKVVRLQEPDELHDSSELGMFHVLNFASPDYSAVGQKKAAPDVLAPFDPPFQREYGISLATLALRYDTQLQGRTSEMRRLLVQVTQQTTNRLTELEQRIMQAESHATQLNAQLTSVLNSHSWKFTAPLRAWSSGYCRLRAAIKEGRLKNAVKNRVRRGLRAAAKLVREQPLLAQPAHVLLRRFPHLKQRLRAALGMASSGGNWQENQKLNPLSPRALQIYAEIKNIVAARKN